MARLWQILSLLLIALFFVVDFNIAKAIPAAPSPSCKVIGEISAIQPVSNDYYNYSSVVFKDFTISDYDNSASDDFCIHLNTSKSKSNIADNFLLSNNSGVRLEKGQTIEAKLDFGGDENFHGYFLSEIKITSGPKAMLIKYWPYAIILFGLILVILFIIFRIKGRALNKST